MKLQSIQILRGLAVLMVVQHHTCWAITTGDGSPPYGDIFGKVGAIGVDLFFVISGFIMNFTITKSNEFGPQKAIYFFIKRMWRIFPPYILWTTVILVLWGNGLILKNHSWQSGQIISSYILWPYYQKESSSITHPILDQGWSLSFECYFYLITAITLATTKPNLLKIFGVFLVIGFASIFFIEENVSKYLMKSPFIFEFLLGWASYSFTSYRMNAMTTFPKYTQHFIFILSITTFVLIAALTSDFSNNTTIRVICWGGISFMLVNVASLILIDEKHFANKIMIAVGNASYSIYLVHGFFTMLLAFLVKKGQVVQLDTLYLTIVMVPVITMLSCIGYFLVEKPLNQIAPNKIIQNAASNYYRRR